jgi:hypothetical protein
VLFADVHVPGMQLVHLHNYLITKDCQGSNPGVHTRRMRVHDDDAGDQEPALMAIMLCMPNLQSFSSRVCAFTPATALSLRQNGRLTLQKLDICFILSDMRSLLAAIVHFTVLQALRIEPLEGLRVEPNAFDTCEPLALPRLKKFEAVLSSYFLPGLARWLARCTLPAIAHLGLEAIGETPNDFDLGGLAEFVPFFSAHQDLHSLSIYAYRDIISALLARQLPPGLRRLALRSPVLLPSTLPPLPRTVRQLALCTDPEDSDLWDLLAHLLRVRELALAEIFVAFEECTTVLPDLTRGFSWSQILLPSRGIKELDAEDTRIRGNMVLYALQFRQRGISIVDEYGYVWPPRGESGQRDVLVTISIELTTQMQG